MSDYTYRDTSVDSKYAWAFSRQDGSLEVTVPPYIGRGLYMRAMDVERLAVLIGSCKTSIAMHTRRLRGLDGFPQDTIQHVYTSSSVDGRVLWVYDTSDGMMEWEMPYGSRFFLNALDVERLGRLLELNKANIIAFSTHERHRLQAEDDSPALAADTVIYG